MVTTEYVTIKHARAILPFPPVPASLSLMQGEHRTYTNLSNEVSIRHKRGHTLQLYTQTNVLGHTNPAPGGRGAIQFLSGDRQKMEDPCVIPDTFIEHLLCVRTRKRLSG